MDFYVENQYNVLQIVQDYFYIQKPETSQIENKGIYITYGVSIMARMAFILLQIRLLMVSTNEQVSSSFFSISSA